MARRWRVPLSTVQYWLRRAAQAPLRRIDFADQKTGRAGAANRVTAEVERAIVAARGRLRQSALGFCGAAAIAEELEAILGAELPSVRTIGRILERQGALDERVRRRQAPPPPGWYLPRVAQGRAELESFDVIEDLRLEGGPLISVLTGRALWRGDAAAWPLAHCVSGPIVDCLQARWRRSGPPAFAQFDNDTRLHGSHRYPDLLGPVVRLCLQAGVTPVFAPPREQGFQNLIESFNGLWQVKGWARFHHADLAALCACNTRFLDAWEQRRLRREETGPRRHELAPDWTFRPDAELSGEIIYLRRCDDDGTVRLLGHTFPVDPQWGHRLVRAEVDLDHDRIRFYRLRRKAPEEQPLIGEVTHVIPRKKAPRGARRPASKR